MTIGVVLFAGGAARGCATTGGCRRTFTYSFGLAAIMLLLLPMLPVVGEESINGARIWIRLGPSLPARRGGQDRAGAVLSRLPGASETRDFDTPARSATSRMVGRRPSASPRSGPPPATSHSWTDPTATVTERVEGGFWSGLVDLMASPGGIGMGRRGLERSNDCDVLTSARNLQHTVMLTAEATRSAGELM